MSTESKPSLSTLPVELIFHIFHYLDAQTIVRSVRRVCKQFYIIVPKYDQFIFNFKSIAKSDFHFLCNFIQPKHVESLTLSDDDDETPGQIDYFLSIFRINQFTRLRSLTLFEIDNCYLNIILKDIKTFELNTLSIYSKRDYSQDNINSIDLLTVISLPCLFKFILNIPSLDISNLSWPSLCTIQHLEIHCHTLDQYCYILCHLPNLRTFVVEQLHDNDADQTISNLDNFEPFHQLYSLTFKYSNIDIVVLELLLLLTPSLKYLQLMRSVDLHAFISHVPQWEKFIETKLPLLNKFEFFLIDDQQYNVMSIDTEVLIAPFRKSFWTMTKNWFVTCDYFIYRRAILLYSSSMFDPQFEYSYKSKVIHRSTSSPTIDNTIRMDGVRKMRLDIAAVMPMVTSPQGGIPNSILFPKLDELQLRISEWPLGSIRFISSLIDLSHLVKLKLEIYNSTQYHSELIANIGTLLKLASNIRSLTIFGSFRYYDIEDRIIKICSLVPSHVKHLTIPVSTVEQMQMILHQLKCPLSIKFEYTNAGYYNSEMHLQWFDLENGYYTYRLNDYSLCMWFDNHKLHRNESN